MYEEVVTNVGEVQNAFTTLATILQLTSYRYPISEPLQDGATYDYIVVGAGTAGSVVASRLTEDPNVSVLLIEAGGDPFIESNLPGLAAYAINNRTDWTHTSQIDPHFKCYQNNKLRIVHGKLLGGTSSINSLYYVRGDPFVYNEWANITGDPSWNYTNIVPLFKKLERIEDPAKINSVYDNQSETDGYISVTRLNYSVSEKYLSGFQELGYKTDADANSNYTLGFSQQTLIIADGLRQGTANGFLSKIKERDNLHVVKETLAAKVLIDSKKEARAVVVIDKNKQRFTVKARKEIIISAGAINTPQILMLSGVGPKEDLQKLNIKVVADLPVGTKLQDHRYANMFIKVKKNNDGPSNPHNPAPVINGFVALNPSQTFPDFQIKLLLVKQDTVVSICFNNYFLNNSVCKNLYEETNGKDGIYVNLHNYDPKSRGRISLKSPNPEDDPQVDYYPFPDDQDLDNYIKYIDSFLRVLNTTYFKSVNAELVKISACNHYEFRSRAYWRCHLQCIGGSGYHFAGSCPMGSVVDSQLRVIGIKRLRVADASIMPIISNGNPMAPALVIGEKAAEMIKRDRCYA